MKFKVKVDDKVDQDKIENTAQVITGNNTVKTNTTKNPTPKQYSLPRTGGTGIGIYLMLGSALVVGAVAVLTYRFYHKRKVNG